MNPTLNFIDGHQISYAVAGACALFLFLLLLFELLRTRLYWIYEPRVHRDDYKSKTPPAPGRTPFAWVRCVFEHWSDYEQYAGVDGVVLAHILRYMTDQCLFAAVVGFAVGPCTARPSLSRDSVSWNGSWLTSTGRLIRRILMMP